jgi:hypothetical protein
MKGFVRPGDNTAYLRALREIERAVTRVGGAASRYFQFGTAVKPIKENPVAGWAGETFFYEDPELFKETRIDRVLEQADPAGLTLISTDLFQNRAEMTLIVAAVRRKLIPQRLALGIWGLRSEYDGRIFDAGATAGDFDYRSTKHPRSFRPAYWLMVGKWPDLVHFAGSLAQSSKALSTQNLVFLCPDLVQQPLQWRNVAVRQAKNMSEDRGLVEPSAAGVGAFRVLGVNDAAALEAEIPFHPVPHTPSVDFSRLAALEVKGKLLAGRRGGAADMDHASIPKQISLTQRAPGSLSLSLKLEPRDLRTDGVYAFAIHPRLDETSVQFPDFVRSWSMDFARQDGAKTLNLHEFVTDVWAVMFADYKPDLGYLYLYLKR